MTLTFAFDPVIAQLGPFQLGWHGIFTALAVLVAVWLAGRLGLQRGIPTEVLYAIAGWGVVGGLIGARLFHVADHLSYYLENPLLIPAIWEGGIAVYGAFIGGLVGASSPPGARISIRGRYWTSPRRRCWSGKGSAALVVCVTATPGAGMRLAARFVWRSATRIRMICCRPTSEVCRHTRIRCMKLRPKPCFSPHYGSSAIVCASGQDSPFWWDLSAMRSFALA